MNPTGNDLLGNLANGVQTCSVPATLDPSVVAALANAVTTQRSIVKTGNPVVTNAIDLGTLNSANLNQWESTFTNNTGATARLVFSTLFGQNGQPADYGITDADVDLPAMHGSDNNGNGGQENGGASKRTYLNFIRANVSEIISLLEVETSATGSQQRQNLQLMTNDVTGNSCANNRLVPFCSACNNNNNSDTFVASFKCPLPLGRGYSFLYPVLDGQTVTMRITTAGLPVDSYETIGGACGCY